jgi:prevent-host-death family protein
VTKSATASVGVHEAKTHLSRLLERVAAGEEIAITRRGEEVARLVPAPPPAELRFGLDRGRFEVPDDFDAPLPDDVLDAFEQ